MVRNIGNPGFPKAIYKQRETYQGGKLGTLAYCTTSNVRRETFGGRFWERWPTTADFQTGNDNLGWKIGNPGVLPVIYGHG